MQTEAYAFRSVPLQGIEKITDRVVTVFITDVYSHIIDEDRKKNAELFEDAFYKKNNLDPNMVSEEVDMELLMKALANPEMRALLNSLAKTMK